MKFKALTTGLLIGLLVGCSRTNQDTTTPSTFESQQASKSETTEKTESPAQPSFSLGKAAQLTDSQIQELVLLEKNTHLKGFKVLLPTYLPTEFRVYKLEILNNNDTNPQYIIVYRRSKDNSCFRLTGDNGQWGGPPAGYHNTVEALSPVLGKIILEYIEFDQEISGSIIKFMNEPIIKYKTGYSFMSSPSIAPNCKDSIRPQEAVKIVQSLKYINP